MNYTSIKKGVFLNRPNRFIANVLVDGKTETVHVKNTGRCNEILIKGASVLLEVSSNAKRKTKYSLIAAYKENTLINIDSQAPNSVIYEAIRQGKIEDFKDVSAIKKEVTFKNSRFDLYFEKNFIKGFIEIKGVTLEKDGIAMFPDAPTQRGTKHILEMIDAVSKNYQGYIIFLIQLNGIKYFTPNKEMDPNFDRALKKAKNKGVKILVYDSIVSINGLKIGNPVSSTV
ncbi:DNA/RNA nuclease SfsA [Herbivorax sp. ANBcel31]|uniref:DNA/RNA nuclease SfsA n=1 Tax=Herbivorax sp. ANBcel31 TaxID=3069754 RepID=UPI0027B76291|nr:DNA/RNA nuclease SfsA [Herbivorax sp. ANBcel31]MDQ2086317.1 DNA/RNA nuclease SfsA [Herbivorax sp. ANBcel31]